MTDDELLAKARELALDAYTFWLNAWHAENDEGVEVTRANYDEYNDPPRVLSHNLDDPNANRLIATIYAHPYHDEGGPTLLYCFFNWTLDMNDYDTNRDLTLELMVQDFDTMIQVIWSNGNYLELP